MTRSFYNESGVRQRAVSGTNARNDKTLDWTTPTTVTVTGVRLQALNAEEIRPGFTGQVLTHRLLAPYGSDFLNADRWVQSGVTYEVDGDGLKRNSPTGVAQHMEVMLRKVDG